MAHRRRRYPDRVEQAAAPGRAREALDAREQAGQGELLQRSFGPIRTITGPG
jgi:hypothetical protein